MNQRLPGTNPAGGQSGDELGALTTRPHCLLPCDESTVEFFHLSKNGQENEMGQVKLHCVEEL